MGSMKNIIFYLSFLIIFSSCSDPSSTDKIDVTIEKVLSGHSNFVRSVVLTDDDKYIISSDNDDIIIWDFVEGTILKTININVPVFQVGVNENTNEIIAKGSGGGTTLNGNEIQFGPITIWDLESGQFKRTLGDTSFNSGNFTLSEDKKYIVYSGSDNKLKMYDLYSGTLIKTFTVSGYVSKVLYTPDFSKIIASSGSNISIFNSNTGSLENTLEVTSNSVRDFVITNDSKFLYVIGFDYKIYYWNIESSELIKTKEMQNISVCAIDPNNDFIVLGANPEITFLNCKSLKKIKSVKHAINLLGEDNVRKFVSLFAIGRMSEDKPHELLKTSCIRAKFCESMSALCSSKISSQELFSLGMFSLLDIILDVRMERVMEELPLTDDLKSALIDQTGLLGDFLQLTIAYEQADWPNTEAMSQKLSIEMDKYPEIYMDACEWADSFSI